MAIKKRSPDTVGVLLIDLNPVVRGLQAILTKDDGTELIPNAIDFVRFLCQVQYSSSDIPFCHASTRFKQEVFTTNSIFNLSAARP